MKRQDLLAARPWTARPTDPDKHSPWEVRSATRRPGGDGVLLGAMLSEANARLISAAPELLEALQAALQHLSGVNWSNSRNNTYTQARDAISKATSEDFDPVAEDENHARMEE